MNPMIDYQSVPLAGSEDKQQIIQRLISRAEDAGYTVVDVDDQKPWGGYIRFDTSDSDAFVSQFFGDAKVGTLDDTGEILPLSPKFLLVAPNQRLSWQRHQLRSEIWRFLTDGGAYSQSLDPNSQPISSTSNGEVVEINQGYCHRLISESDKYLLVAEIWRHIDLEHLSDEDDNERLQDDYNR